MADRKSERTSRGEAGRGRVAEPRRKVESRQERPLHAAPETDRGSATDAASIEEDRPKRRRLSAERKLQIFVETSIPGAPIGEILRREGLYTSDLARIRDQVREGALEKLKQGPGRRKKSPAERETERLLEELRKKEKALIELTMENLALKKSDSKASKDR
jgi:transposase-like protein